MATSDTVDDSPPVKPFRSRKSHPKVKTGCLTCKIRRKKCDETRPACQRCTSTGRKCDGYPTIGTPLEVRVPATSDRDWRCSENSSLNEFSAEWSQTVLTTTNLIDQTYTAENGGTDFSSLLEVLSSKPNLLWNPSQLIFSSDREHYCYSFFRGRTGLELSAYYGNSFWSNAALQSCIFDSGVRQAVAAIGAVHRRMEMGITPEAFEYCEFALRSYTGALNNFNQGLKSGDAKSLEQGMIMPVLFSVFEAFQGNSRESKMHMAGWLKIFFNRQLRRLQRSTTHSSTVLDVQTLRDLFRRLEIQAAEFFQDPPLIREEPPSDLSIPKDFKTLEQARDMLFSLVHCFLRFLEKKQPGGSVSLNYRQRYGRSLLEWSYAHADYSKNSTPHSPQAMNRGSALLRIYRHAACLLLLMHSPEKLPLNALSFHEAPSPILDTSSIPPPARKNVYNAHLTRLIIRADTLLDLYNQLGRPSLVIDSGTCSLIDNLAGGDPGRSNNLRNLVLSLATENAGSLEKMWETRGAYSVAEKIAAMEEESLLAFVADANGGSDQFQALSMDVIIYMEERRVLMRLCVPDPKGDGSLVWTQDLMGF